MKPARALLALAGVLTGQGQVQAQAQAVGVQAPWLWAAPALYGLDFSACTPAAPAGARDASERAAASAALTAIVHPAFCAQLAPNNRAAIGRAFADAVARHFPQVEPVFGQHLPADASQRARLRGTLAVSLRMSRASLATVPKGREVDAYLPITLTLDVTNMATGEVVFTRTHNPVGEGVYPADRVEADVAAQFPGQLAAAVEALVTDAATAFRPRAQVATVLGDVSLGKGEDRGWVVNLGRTSGLRRGESIGSDGKVLYAGPDYAVVQPTLETYRSGQQLARTVLSPAEAMGRSGVLVVMDAVPAGYARPWLGQIFEDATGTAGTLAPVPVNPAFSALRTLALSSAAADLKNDDRSLPDYVALVRVELVEPASYPSNLAGVEVDHFEAHAFVSLTDATGRVVGGWHGSAKIDDQINAGVRFSGSQRPDAVIRNALLDAARKMAAFRPQPQFLPLSPGRDGTFVIADPIGTVPLGMTLPVLRQVGRFKGLAGAVMVPVGEVNVQEPTSGGVVAVDQGLVPISLKGGEVVALETAGIPAQSRRVVSQCLDAAGAPRVDVRGSVPVPMWAAAAETLLASKAPVPLHLATLPTQLQRFSPYFAGWDTFAAARAAQVQTCVLPVLAIEPAGPGQAVTVGYSLRQGETKVGASGLRVVLTPTRMPASASAGATAAMLQADLAGQVPGLAEQAAATLKPAP